METTRAVATCAAALAALLAATPTAMAQTEADTTPPTAPGSLHAVSVSDVDIVLAWNASTDDSGSVNYAVFFDDYPTPFLTSAATQLDVHLNRAIAMIPGSSHTFQVRAEDPSGNHSFSNALTVSFAAGDNNPPTAPSNLRVVSNTASGVELAWDPSTDLVPSIQTDPVCGLVPGTTATFSVRARDALDNGSAFSNSVTVTFAPNQ